MSEFKYAVFAFPDDDGDGYYAIVPDLPGCMGDGETPQDAVKDAIEASKAWIEVQLDNGDEVPAPGVESERVDDMMEEREDYIADLEAKLAAANKEIRALKASSAAKIGKFPVRSAFHAA